MIVDQHRTLKLHDDSILLDAPHRFVVDVFANPIHVAGHRLLHFDRYRIIELHFLGALLHDQVGQLATDSQQRFAQQFGLVGTACAQAHTQRVGRIAIELDQDIIGQVDDLLHFLRQLRGDLILFGKNKCGYKVAQSLEVDRHLEHRRAVLNKPDEFTARLQARASHSTQCSLSPEQNPLRLSLHDPHQGVFGKVSETYLRVLGSLLYGSEHLVRKICDVERHLRADRQTEFGVWARHEDHAVDGLDLVELDSELLFGCDIENFPRPEFKVLIQSHLGKLERERTD